MIRISAGSSTGLTASIAFLLILSGAADAQMGCTAQDRQTIDAYTQRYVELAMYGDVHGMLQLNEQLEGALSPSCIQALSAAQQYQYAPQPRGAMPYGYGAPPGVYDHGGGTYSVPGVGACGPGGCLPY